MSKQEYDRPPDSERWADVQKRFEDIYRPAEGGRWALIKDRLAIVAVIVVLAFLVFMMIDGSIENFRCTFAQFMTFECNRWDAAPKPWQ